MYIFTAFVFVVAVSIDIFVCGFAYGANGLRVPVCKVILMNIIGTGMIAAGLFIGYFLGSAIDKTVTAWCGFGVFMAIGVIKSAQWFAEIRRAKKRQLREISWAEAVVLGALLSIDGFIAGVGASLTYLALPFIVAVIGFSVLADSVFFACGQALGHKLNQKANLNLGWLSGLILIVMAILHLVFS